MRKAKRRCPALGHSICAVCCGSKRLKEIHCPTDCVYLATAREHPPAVVLRQQQHDFGLLMQLLRDLSERQSQLFVLVAGVMVRYRPLEFQPLLDDDVRAAAAALAATFETAARGVIYEHRPESLVAGRLLGDLKEVLSETGKTGGTAFERDAAVVLRRIEAAVAEVTKGTGSDPSNRRPFLDLLGRTFAKDGPVPEPSPGETPGLIVP